MMEFLLNISTRTIHNAASTDKRCRIALMQDGNKKIFSTYQGYTSTSNRKWMGVM